MRDWRKARCAGGSATGRGGLLGAVCTRVRDSVCYSPFKVMDALIRKCDRWGFSFSVFVIDS